MWLTTSLFQLLRRQAARNCYARLERVISSVAGSQPSPCQQGASPCHRGQRLRTDGEHRVHDARRHDRPECRPHPQHRHRGGGTELAVRAPTVSGRRGGCSRSATGSQWAISMIRTRTPPRSSSSRAPGLSNRGHGRAAADGRLDFRPHRLSGQGQRVSDRSAEIGDALLECGAGTAKVFVDDSRIVAAVTEGGEGCARDRRLSPAAYMQPRQILLVDNIPVTANSTDVKALVLMRPASSPATSVAPVSRPGSCVPTPAPSLTATGPAGRVPARGDGR